MAEYGKKNVSDDRKIIDEHLKSGEIAGFYYLYGEETFMRDYYAKRLKSACAGQDIAKQDVGFNFGGDFDVVRFTDGDFSVKALYDEFISYPLSLKCKYIEIREADLSKIGANDKKLLEEIFADKSNLCCVVFIRGAKAKEGKTDAVTSLIMKNSLCAEFKINGKTELVKWLRKIFAASKIEISPQAAEYMLSFGSNDMYRLQSEAAKLIDYALYTQKDGTLEISTEEIDLIVSRTEEIEAFEFTNSILEGKFGRTIQILNKMESLKEEPLYVFSQLIKTLYDLKVLHTLKDEFYSDAKLISKQTGMHEYRIRLYLGALSKKTNAREFLNKSLTLAEKCDIMSKSVYSDGYTLLYNLVYAMWAV